MKTRAQLAEVDAAVYAAVSGGARRMTQILAYLAQTEAACIADNRTVDRSLQRLRQRDRVTYESKIGWSARI